MARLKPTPLIIVSLLVILNKPISAQNHTNSTEGLHSLFVEAGKLYFGTAMETNNLNDTAYMAIATNKNEFGLITPENSQKWETTQPRRNTFSFVKADEIISKAQLHGQLIRCHTLTWHSQLPSFGKSSLEDLSLSVPIILQAN